MCRPGGALGRAWPCGVRTALGRGQGGSTGQAEPRALSSGSVVPSRGVNGLGQRLLTGSTAEHLNQNTGVCSTFHSSSGYGSVPSHDR